MRSWPYMLAMYAFKSLSVITSSLTTARILSPSKAQPLSGVTIKYVPAIRIIAKNILFNAFMFRSSNFLFQMFNGLFQQTAIKVKPDRRDKPVLLLSQKVSCPADLQIFKRNLKTGAQIAVLFNRLQPLARDVRHPILRRHHKIS